jgi:hypothetical protein
MAGPQGLLSQTTAQEVVEALRDGAVPRGQTDAFSVGRDAYLRALRADLAFISAGGYKVRFVAGDLGYGKTLLLSRFAQAALAEGFAVSHVELHAREAPLEKTEVITSAVIRNTRFPSLGGLEPYLHDWCRRSELLDRDEIDGWLSSVSSSLEFRAALRCVLAAGSGNADIVGDIVQWLFGGAPSSALTRQTGIRSSIRPVGAAELLTSFVDFVHASGTPGVILLLDEAEAITSLTQASRRDEANQTLRRLLDNPESRGHFGVVFATTTRFLQDPKRGARSYPALWERIRSVTTTAIFNPRATVLSLSPLERRELLDLGQKLRGLHGRAYDWEPRLSDNALGALIDAVYRGQLGAPRRYVKGVIAVLDILEADSTCPEMDAIQAVADVREDE